MIYTGKISTQKSPSRFLVGRGLNKAVYGDPTVIEYAYTLPAAWTRKIGIQALRLYFEGTNLFFLYNSLSDYGFDPEISTVNGYDYPQHRVLSLGVNVKF